jgi:hypothetical protein
MAESGQRDDEDYKQVVLPSLLVDVKPNDDDVEPDTILPYFLKFKAKLDKRKAEAASRAAEKQMRMKESVDEELKASTGTPK